ncbi:MAG TPA: AarF/UbiB family protein, partial [Chroococcales cyanobacterium]
LAKIAHYGFTDLLEGSKARKREGATERPDTLRARNFRLLLQDLGPTTIKLGQILSTRSDLLPPAYIEELQNLQDSVPFAPFEEIEKTIELELGAPLSRLFASIEHQPLAAASLAQVHAARLKSGEEVVVKVLYPGVSERIEKDLPVLRMLADFLAHHSRYAAVFDFPGITDQLESTLHRELDLEFERNAMERIRQSFHCERIVIPRAFPRYSTRHLLTMQRIFGKRVSLSPPGGEELAAELLIHTFHQVVEAGFFHADPHPGNFLITREGKLAILDFGMIGTLDFRMRREVILLLMALVNQQGDRVAEELVRMGEPRKDFELAPFRREVAATLGQYQFLHGPGPKIGEMMVALIRKSASWHLKSPPEFILLSKTLLQLESMARELDPEVRPAEIVAPHLEGALKDLLRENLSAGVLWPLLSDFTELVLNSSRRLNLIGERLISEDKVRFQFEHIGLDKLVSKLVGAGNRLAVAVVAAALLLFSSNLLQARLGTLWVAIAAAAFILALFLVFYIFLAVARGKEF